MEPGWLHLVLELSEEIEKSQRALFELDNVLPEISRVIHDALDFEFVAIQLFNKEDRTIQTVHATGTQEDLIGLAKHPIDGEDTILDIQASVFNADPPKIKIISGWDPHFDKLIYDQFNHACVVRVWTPIIVLKDKDGNILSEWSHMKPWSELTQENNYTETIDGQKVPRFNINICLDKARVEQRYGPIFIDKLGTVEAGHHRLREGMTPETAVFLADIVTQLAISGAPKSPLRPSLTAALPSLREASLDYVLETTAKSAMRMLGGKAATLHFRRDEIRDRYVYEVASGAIGSHFLATHPPRKDGVGHQAIKEKRPIVLPDLGAGQATTHLETANPPAWAVGIRTMAVFPLIVGDKDGVLYIGFGHSRCLAEYEIDVIELFLRRATQAIKASTYHKDALDENRRLTNLNSIAQLLVNQQTDQPLLYKIGGTALNLLAADVVTMHEYAASNDTFLDAAIAGHLRDPDLHYYLINQHRSAHNLAQHNSGVIVDQDLEDRATVRDLAEDVRGFLSFEGFVSRHGIVIRYAEEVFGVMFVYYRRRYKLSPQDRKAIEILAAHAAIAIRIRRSFQETCSQIGHDFNRQISRLASRVSLLNNELNKMPYVADIFWNSEAGDLFKGIVTAKNNITRFAIEFQEFGKSISIKRKQVKWAAFVEKKIRRFRRETHVEVQSQAEGTADRSAAVVSRPVAIETAHEPCSEELLVEIDEVYIARAIDAVMNNAIQALSENKQPKASAPPRIWVVTRTDTDLAGHLFAVISIADNGPGVPQARKEKIFQLFYTTRVNEGGNGIGLASARRYVELHGGTLWEIGQYGEGADLVIRLPALPRPAIGSQVER